MTVNGGIAIVALAAAMGTACGQPAKHYELTGQILGVKPEAHELLIKHDEIKGFMAAMTMPYKVERDDLLKDRQPGDLIKATLVVSDRRSVLSAVTKTGSAPIDQPPPAQTVTPIEVLTPGKAVPDVQLVDQAGKARPFASFKGHRVAMTFMYTSCPMPDFCPLMDRNFAAVQVALRKAPELSDVRLISVTIDPKVDTPSVLKAHAAKLKADPQVWSFVTGDEEAIARFAAQFGLAVVHNDKDPSDISHTLRTVVIDAEGQLRASHNGNAWTPSELLADIAAVPAPAH